MVPAHHTLHAVDRADHVALVNHIAAAHADENILRVVGHADDFVGHHLTGGNDEVIALVHDAPVDLDTDRVAPEPFGDFAHIVRRDLPQLHHVMSPVMDQHGIIGNIPEHPVPLVLTHGNVGAQGGHDIHRSAPLCERVVIDVGDTPRI